MVTLRELILKKLLVPDREQTYNERFALYGNLPYFLPDSFEDIILDNSPWFVHGLAFRMATFPIAEEKIFQRLNVLIGMAKQLDGWENESKNTAKSWSKNYDEFFHFLWMLQCMEYFLEHDYEVRFTDTTNAKPDLILKPVNANQFFAECYAYSKWWFKESFFEEIIHLIHPNLRIERKYNLKTESQGNVFNDLLTCIGNILTPEKLDTAEKEASIKSPYLIHEIGNIRILLYGDGEYKASVNAHGDPLESINVYLNEIVKSKEKQNALTSCRPNILMVNGLGVDYQNVFFRSAPKGPFLNSDSIDEVVLFACGIDEKISECARRPIISLMQKHNNAINADSEKWHFFVTQLFTAGYGEH
jgi:hypothetical protein